jgi:hypothetical protein
MITLLQQLRRLMARFSSPVATGHAVLVRDHCKHCEKRTMCEVNVLREYYRCRSCGKDPYSGPALPHEHNSAGMPATA